MPNAPVLYDLTPLTRKVNEKRRVVVQGWDIDRRYFIIFLAGVPVVALLIAATFRFMGSYSMLMVPLVYVPMYWALATRSPHGLEMMQWRTVYEKRRSNNGHLMLRGKRLDPDRHAPRVLVSASVPGPAATRLRTDPQTGTDDLF